VRTYDDGVRGGGTGSRWNHNIHLHRAVLAAIPDGARSALDVHAGDGLLAAELRAVIPEVVAVDVDANVLARASAEHPGIDWVCADVMTHDFGRTFDVVASVATVHHLPDLDAALRRLAGLTSPRGVLVVVGLARSTTPWDHLLSLAGVIQHQWLSRTRGYWEHSAPTAPPAHSFRQVRRIATQALPGARWHRSALWRYALTWPTGVSRSGSTQPSPDGA
jgi:SAM-dependent methyltransferase